MVESMDGKDVTTAAPSPKEISISTVALICKGMLSQCHEEEISLFYRRKEQRTAVWLAIEKEISLAASSRGSKLSFCSLTLKGRLERRKEKP